VIFYGRSSSVGNLLDEEFDLIVKYRATFAEGDFLFHHDFQNSNVVQAQKSETLFKSGSAWWSDLVAIRFTKQIIHQRPVAEDSIKGQQQSMAFNVQHQKP